MGILKPYTFFLNWSLREQSDLIATKSTPLKDKDDVLVIPTEKIYPFMVNVCEYRKATPNECIKSDNKILHNCLNKKYPSSLALYHSGFGGSWSW